MLLIATAIGVSGIFADEKTHGTDQIIFSSVNREKLLKEGNTCFQKDDMQAIYEKMKRTDVLVIASPVYFYGVSAQLKAMIDRLHTPLRKEFPIKKLGLILVGADTLPKLFDSIKMQYQLTLSYFHLQDAGMVLVRGAEKKGNVKNGSGLREAYELGLSVK